MKYVVLSVCVLGLFVSCLGIEQTIMLNEDGSGSISFIYRIPKEFADLGSYGDYKKPVALPVQKSDFERVLTGSKGLVLSEYKTSEDEKDLIVYASISFASANDLDQFEFPDHTIIHFKTGKDGSRFEFDIPTGEGMDISDESAAIIAEMSDGYAINVIVKSPKKVTTYTLGELSKDSRTITYRTTLSDLVRNKGKLSLVMTW